MACLELNLAKFCEFKSLLHLRPKNEKLRLTLLSENLIDPTPLYGL